MAAILQDLEDRIARLSAEDRTCLIEGLIHSLDTNGDNDTEQAWLETIEQRHQEYRAGMLTSKSTDMAFKDAESKSR